MQQTDWEKLYGEGGSENARKLAVRVSVQGIVINLALTVFKLIAGIVASSSAMLSDAVHSASDVFSTIIVIIGVNISAKASDKEHPYGHERLEAIAAILLSAILFATGLGIGWDGLKKIIGAENAVLQTPGMLALIAAVVSVVVKEWMYWYTRSAAKKTNSTALMASAWDHRSDAFSSVGSFLGILGARLGLAVLDPIAGLLICFFIIKAAFSIFKDAADRLVDRSCDQDIVQKMRDTILAQNGVIGVDMLETRLFGSRIYVDTEVSADPELMLRDSHAIAEAVHESIEKGFPDVKHCMVHVNPAEEAEGAEESADKSKQD